MSTQYPFTTDELGTATHIIKSFLDEQNKAPPVEAVVQEVDETADGIERNKIEAMMDEGSVYTNTSSLGKEVVTDVTVRGSPPTYLDGFTTNNSVFGDRSTGEIRPIEASTTGEDADFTEFDGISDARADALADAGYNSFNDIHNASKKDITSIEGFRDTLAGNIKNEASRKLDPHQQIAAKGYEKQRAFEKQGPLIKSIDDLKNVASDVEEPIGETLDKEFNGLTVHEPIDHPFIDDESKYDNLQTRTLISGEEDISFIPRLIQENDYSVLLEGHAGIGKNYLLDHILAKTNRPSLRINIDSSMLSKDLLGVHKIGQDRTVVWDPGPIPKAVQYGWTVIVDEPNVAREGVMLCLQQLAEKDGVLHVKGENSVIEPHPAFRVVFTQNPSTAEYRGTEELNDSFMSRIYKVKMPYLGEDEESDLLYQLVNNDRERLTRKDCTNLVSLANRFRSQVDDNARLPRITTRDLQKVAPAADGPVTIEGATRLVIQGCLGSRDNEEAAMNLVADEMT